MDYWSKIVSATVPTNEYYPWEHGFPPTAFSLYAACQINLRMGLKSEALEAKFAKTAGWLG